MHRLLERQLKRHYGKDKEIPEAWQDFIAAVDEAYAQADADRALMERSLDLASDELFERNRQLNELFAEEQAKNQLIENQSRALLDIVQSVALGDLDVEVDVPEGIEVLSELAIGIEMMIDDIQEMLDEQERARQIIETALAQTEELYVGSDRVLRSKTAEDVLYALIRSSILQKYERTSILLFDTPLSSGEVPTSFTVAATWDQSGESPSSSVGTRINYEQHPASNLLNRHEPLIIWDVTNDDRLDSETELKAELLENDIANLGFWPLGAGDQWLGIVTGQSERVFRLDDNELRQINSLTDQAAIVIQGIQLYEQAQSALAEAEATHRLYLRQRWEEYTGRRDTQLSFAPQVFSQLPETEAPDESQPAQDPDSDSDSVLNIPIAIRGQAIGQLGVEIPQGGQELSPEQQALVDTISQQMGLALENLRLIEETQRSASREQVIREITAQIRETLDIETVLNTATTEIGRSLGLAALDIQLGTSPD